MITKEFLQKEVALMKARESEIRADAERLNNEAIAINGGIQCFEFLIQKIEKQEAQEAPKESTGKIKKKKGATNE